MRKLKYETFFFFFALVGSVHIHTGSRRGGSEQTRLRHVYDNERACHVRQRRHGDSLERSGNTLLRVWPNGPLPTGP